MYNKITFLIVVVLSSASSAAPERDLFSDTWVATDALGRQLPGYEECGPVRADRAVGIFYFLWLGQHGTGGPFDITRLLAEDPDSPQWGPPGAFHHWGRAELGYYLSDSEYVIRKHAFMLNDAGIDTLIFDVTNAFTYYYYQMISYIRRYKGVRRRRRAESDYSIQIDGRFDDWKEGRSFGTGSEIRRIAMSRAGETRADTSIRPEETTSSH